MRAARRWTAALALVVAMACAESARAGARARPARRLVGHDGDATLVVDPGRRLVARKRPIARLRPIEEARQEARLVFASARLTSRQQATRLMQIARDRLPVSPALADQSQLLSTRDAARAGETRLSRHVEQGIGRCRERAHLLAVLLGEVGVTARVRAGVLYDANGDALGDEGHAWVEARMPGTDEFLLLDPTIASRAVPRQLREIRETLPGGQVRRVRSREAFGLTYVPLERSR